MARQGKQGANPSTSISQLGSPSRDLGPVFPGKPHLNPPQQHGNLAIKRSLIEIFDEFSQVISGELKSMNLERFEGEQNHRQP